MNSIFCKVLKDDEDSFEAIYTDDYRVENYFVTLVLLTKVGNFQNNVSLWQLNLNADAAREHVRKFLLRQRIC